MVEQEYFTAQDAGDITRNAEIAAYEAALPTLQHILDRIKKAAGDGRNWCNVKIPEKLEWSPEYKSAAFIKTLEDLDARGFRVIGYASFPIASTSGIEWLKAAEAYQEKDGQMLRIVRDDDDYIVNSIKFVWPVK
jgi:hypothetical protein